MEEYKYLSIENRTLLKIKEKLLEKELECARLKVERDQFKGEKDQFKKKTIEYHKMLMELEDEDECNGESMFSLSSISELV